LAAGGGGAMGALTLDQMLGFTHSTAAEYPKFVPTGVMSLPQNVFQPALEQPDMRMSAHPCPRDTVM
jgi:hypothetical protein